MASSAASNGVGAASPSDKSSTADYSTGVGGRTKIGYMMLAEDGGKSCLGETMTLCGWVRTVREQADITFMNINDGSCQKELQCVLDKDSMGVKSKDLKTGDKELVPAAEVMKGAVNTGASVKVTGVIVENPKQQEQMVDLKVTEIEVLGAVDAAAYPVPNKKHSLEYLREIAHLRPRTAMFGCVARVRSSLAFATHEFFRKKGMLYVHTPLITASDCEGAGEMFQVTTLLDDYMKKDGEEGKKKWPVKPEYFDFSKDFFKKKAYLSVSGQLAVENYCCALSSVYTFGPTFRAEKSHSTRHLAEFWMIEPELAFADLYDDMACAEEYLKYCVRYVMEHNKQDLEFFEKRVEKGLWERLTNLVDSPFARLSYGEAIELLQEHVANGEFQKYLDKKYAKEKKSWDEWRDVQWGMDLNSSHEKYMAEEIYKKPVIVYNYPAKIKAFYMKYNGPEAGEPEGRETVRAMDILAPLVGEVVGGSQREEDLDKLDAALDRFDLVKEDYWWYRELRKYGTVPHSGFGLGFERLIMLTTGMENIRDVIPFPRYHGHAEF